MVLWQEKEENQKFIEVGPKSRTQDMGSLKIGLDWKISDTRGKIEGLHGDGSEEA